MALPDCTPPTATFTQTAADLLAEIAADTTGVYQYENKGKCKCCPCTTDPSTFPATLFIWLNGAFFTLTKVTATSYSGTGTGPGGLFGPDNRVYDVEFSINANCSISLIISEGLNPCGDVGYGTPVGGYEDELSIAHIRYDHYFLTHRAGCTYDTPYYLRICETNPCPPKVVTTNQWFRVETGVYPYCDCLQNVTDVVAGPFDTKANCTATCTPVQFCATYQDYDVNNNKIGAPYKGCITGNFTVGTQTTESGGAGSYRTRLISDGPFLSGCDCGPCGPIPKDPLDAGCGTVYIAVSGSMAPGASSSPSMISMSPMLDWIP